MPRDDLKAQYLDATYEELCPLKRNAFVVRHRHTGKIYVKKYVDKALLPIYQKLQQIQDRRTERVFDHAADERRGIVITEYISGRTLQEYREDRGSLPEWEVCAIIQDLLLTLRTIHSAGIIHRDITSSNVMISNDGTLKLIDFNIARQRKNTQGTDTTILGTAGYAAPEQYGFSQTDQRTDIYSVGVLWNVLLTGCFPSEKRYTGHPLSMIIQRCTEMDSRQRYQNVQEILDEMESCGLRRPQPQPRADTQTDAQEIHTWIPGFRTAVAWKCIVAVLGYSLMILYSIYSISECSATWLSLILEAIAIILYMWLTPLVAANIGYFDRKIHFLKRVPTSARVTIRIIFCVTLFTMGAAIESYVRGPLLGITK